MILPEYPDITIYLERLDALVTGQVLEQVRVVSPFLLRTAKPPLALVHNAVIKGFERIGKRIVFVCPEEHFLVLHLMINGRLYWRKQACKIPLKKGLAAFDFPNGSLLLTEVGARKRASLQVIKGRENLKNLDPGGLEIFDISFEAFHKRLISENHTLKRTLTDPSLFSGIGNAYSDEILHRARLSPILLTEKMVDDQIKLLYKATREVLREWTQRLRAEVGQDFPEKVTAFRPEMAVHGRFKKPCQNCGSPNPTNPVCRKRNQLLPHMPNRRKIISR